MSEEDEALFDSSAGYYFVAWSSRGDIMGRTTNGPVKVAPPENPGNTLRHTRLIGENRESYHYTERNDCVLVGRSVEPENEALTRFAFILLAAGGGILALGTGGGWFLATQTIRPIEDISTTAKRISEGNLAERIPAGHPGNELHQLAGVLNNTFARLDDAFSQQKQFIADASHELRTPLSVIITEAQLALSREREVGEYEETIEVCLHSAQQMRRLAASLLLLARTDSGNMDLVLEHVDLTEIARQRCADLQHLIEEAGLTLRLECESPVGTECDADRLGQVITNLVTNAMRYNKPSGGIRVETRTGDGGQAILEVADTGCGISEDDLPRIFDRFYRVDASRFAAEGRTGLGLAICKSIVEAHGGRITVESTLGEGSCFRVSFPPGQPGRDQPFPRVWRPATGTEY